MTTQLDQQQIIHQLGKMGRELDQLVREISAQELKWLKSNRAATHAEAVAYLQAEGPVEIRKRTAFLAAEELLDQAEVDGATLRHLKSQIKALEIRIDIGRTLSATTRAELAILGGPNGKEA